MESVELLDHRWLDSHRYGVIDAAWRGDIPAQWPITVIAPSFLGNDTDRCPVLLDIHSLQQDQLGELMELLIHQVSEREDSICSLLLQSDSGPKAVNDHLAKRMVIRLPGQDQPKQFRYFDPGTFLQLPHLLGHDGMAWLLGPVKSVLVPWAGQWTRCDRPAQPGVVGLQTQQLQGLARIGVVNRAALQQVPPRDSAAWRETCAAMDAVVQRAMECHGLVVQADLVAFALHAMHHHPSFDRHPRLQALLARLKTATPHDEIDYRQLTSELTPQDWQAICRELPTPSTQSAHREGSKT